MHALVTGLQLGDDAARATVSDLLYMVLDAAMLSSCLVAARTSGMDRATRRAWLLLGASVLLTFAGDAIWAWLELVERSDAYPSLADVAYLACYPVQLVALLTFPITQRGRSERWKFRLDVLLASVAGGMIVWDVVLGPLAAASATGDPFAVLVGVGYPVADVVLLFGVVRLTLLAGVTHSRRAISLLTASLLLYLLTDLVYSNLQLHGSYASGGLLDVGWTGANALLVVAAIVQRREYGAEPVRRPARRLEHARSLAPYLLVAAAYGLLVDAVVEIRQGVDGAAGSIGLPGLVLGSIAITGLVVIRQYASVRERVDAEMGARGLEARFRALVQGGRDLMFIVGSDATITYASPSVATVLGRDPELCVGAGLTDLVEPDDVATLQRTLIVLSAGDGRQGDEEATTTLRLTFESAAGIAIAHEVVLRDLRHDPAVSGIVVSAHDVSEHVDVVERLESRYQDVVDAVGEVIFETDAAGRWTFLSPAWTALTGYPVGESLGRPVGSFAVPGDGRSASLDGVRDEAGFHEMVRCSTRDGGVCWMEVHARPVHDATGALAGATGTLRDITARRAAEGAVAEAKEEAERANRAKSEFLSRMSHELRTPMNSILGFSELLQFQRLDPADRECVDHIVRAGHHLLDLINEVLDIARIETDRVEFAIDDLALGPLAREAIQIVRPLAAARAITLVEELDGGEHVTVAADRQRLVQVLLNLLTNAVKYNRERGTVTVGVVPGEPGRSRLEVRDTGRGIAPELLDRLFVPFDRLGAEHGTEEGTGLGLAVSKGLMDGMGGSLGVRSTPGVGSTFWVDLPTGTSAIREAATVRTVAAGTHHHGQTVLVVEDNPANRELAGRVLARIDGLDVVLAEDGATALRRAHEVLPDLILLDLSLPDLSGEDVLRRLREDPATRHIRVAILSADATPERRADLLAAGAVDYVAKPFDVGDLVRAVTDLLAVREEVA